jgi:catechol 2,3-dioxygenase-like lactoylglutathione lyase family enzyme
LAAVCAKLVPELDVSDIGHAVEFYTAVCGFGVLYKRDEERFAYLERDGAEIMLQEATGPGRRFRTAPLERPFGRGVNLQIEVGDVASLYRRMVAEGLEPVVPLERRAYRVESQEVENEQFVVADPDGYLLRFWQDAGPP